MSKIYSNFALKLEKNIFLWFLKNPQFLREKQQSERNWQRNGKISSTANLDQERNAVKLKNYEFSSKKHLISVTKSIF